MKFSKDHMFWITFEEDNISILQIAEMRNDLHKYGLEIDRVIGLGLTTIQEYNLKVNLNLIMKIDPPEAHNISAYIMGFPVRIMD